MRIAVREYGIKAIRICPMFTGIAIDDKLAYPLYTAACDEGAVVTINVGVPGPMKPAKLQRTILIDEVALAFPDLKLVMTHLGDPWISETVSMLVKHPNVFAMTAGLGAEVRARGDPQRPAPAQQDQGHVVLGLPDPALRPHDHRGPGHRAPGGLADQLPGRERPGRLRRAPRRVTAPSSETSRRSREMGLHDGRVVIITGAAGGIGREHALEFARQGASIVVNDVGPVDDVVAEIKELGGQAVGNNDDVSDWDGAGRLVQTALDTFGELHVLVNNAGILRDKMFVNMDVQMWDDVMKVHLRGTFCPTRHAVNYWRSQHKAGTPVAHPRIINTSSPSGLYGNVGQSNYGAAKAALAAFTVILADELARLGITVNAIAPSALTQMTEGLDEYVKKMAEIKERTGFDAGSPANIAPIVVWLATPEAAGHHWSGVQRQGRPDQRGRDLGCRARGREGGALGPR